MGKKGKTGKSRKDKFYHLAKETGYRSRAAFKLLQLNRKFEFLQKSRVCIDLCAAPGGWLQVAQKFMPMSSVIVGVDLVNIKPVFNVTTFQEDITTEKCRQTLKKELQTWSADVVLHDGAPNVGQNWLHDSFQQAQLTLQAMRLAVEFLRKGGWFVTKVFRSKDYNALLWVFQQLFKKVHATKPQASRNESAEIFVVCEHFMKPDKIDPRFTDPKYVFKDVGLEGKTIDLIHPEKRKKKVEGYADGDYTLHHKLSASEFISADNYMELLGNTNQIVLDENLMDHKCTTTEIKACCEDIQVLGKKEIRSLISWRKKLRSALEMEESQQKGTKEDGEGESGEEDEEDMIRKQVEELNEEEKRNLKKKRKKVMKEKRVLRDRMALNMVIPGDTMDTQDDIALFDLHKIKKKHHLTDVEAAPMEQAVEHESSDDDEADESGKKRMSYERHDDDTDDPSDESDAEENDLEFESDKEHEEEREETFPPGVGNPLVVDLPGKGQRKTAMWFSKSVFDEVLPEDEDELGHAVKAYEKLGGQVKGVKQSTDGAEDSGHGSGSDALPPGVDEDDDDDDDSSDSDSSDSDDERTITAGGQHQNQKKRSTANKDGFEIVPANQTKRKLIKLDSVELAIGEEIVKSKKRRREIEELSYNRYTSNDDSAPDWFLKDESKHCKIQLPVTKEQIDYYKDKKKAIDAKPIKKVAEAKARKKRKMTKKVERARKKAELVSDSVDSSDREKWKQIKDIYKKAGLLKKQQKEVAYVVAKKGVGRRVRRPTGIKGRFRVVDPRMKKDNMANKKKEKVMRKKGGGGKQGKKK